MLLPECWCYICDDYHLINFIKLMHKLFTEQVIALGSCYICFHYLGVEYMLTFFIKCSLCMILTNVLTSFLKICY